MPRPLPAHLDLLVDSFEETLDLAGRGDPDALSSLLAELLPSLRAYVRLHASPELRRLESSADLVQSVCRELLEGIAAHGFSRIVDLRAWLLQAALNKIVDKARYYAADRRDRARHDRLRADDESVLECYESFCTPSRHAAARERLRSVEATMDRLPPEYRRVIVLHNIVGYSHAEIGKKLKRSPGAVRILLWRAVQRLRRELGEAEDSRG